MGRPELPDGRAVAALGARPEPRRRGAPAPISFRGRRGGRGPQPGCGRSARPRRPRRGKMAAAAQALSGAGLLLAAAALALLAVAIGTDSWYETDARRHRERCRGFGHKRSDPPGSMSAPSSHLPLRARPARALLPGRPPAPAPAAAAAALDSHCGRRFNSTVSGLWRRCHRAGYEPDSEELIRKGAGRREGRAGRGRRGRGGPARAAVRGAERCRRTGAVRVRLRAALAGPAPLPRPAWRLPVLFKCCSAGWHRGLGSPFRRPLLGLVLGLGRSPNSDVLSFGAERRVVLFVAKGKGTGCGVGVFASLQRMTDGQASVVTDVCVCVMQGYGGESHAGVLQHKARWFVVCE